jgi:hypothetical protein
MYRYVRMLLLSVLLCQSWAAGRSLIAVTTWPSFRIGNDIGRFDWYFDIRWAGVSYWGTTQGDSVIDFQDTYLNFEPSLGCNYALYDSTFSAYIGAGLGTLLQFTNSAYSDDINIQLSLGGGIEWAFSPKLSIIGEYLLGFQLTLLPETTVYGATNIYHTSLSVYNKPSLQLRYYIGPDR